MLQTETWK